MPSKRKPSEKMFKALERLKRGDKLYYHGACSGYIVLTESGKKLLGESAYVAAAQPAHSVKQST